MSYYRFLIKFPSGTIGASGYHGNSEEEARTGFETMVDRIVSKEGPDYKAEIIELLEVR